MVAASAVAALLIGLYALPPRASVSVTVAAPTYATLPLPPLAEPELVPVAPVTTVAANQPYAYRRLLVSAAKSVWGAKAPVPLLAAQIHHESGWKNAAVSWAGAKGLTQFMPATARAITAQHAVLQQLEMYSPPWAVTAQSIYMQQHFLASAKAVSKCDRWAFALSRYNGGQRALTAEQRAAKNTWAWFGAGGVAAQRARAPRAWRENRGYVTRIFELEPQYASLGKTTGCADA